jgi:hypothetical protein
LADSTRLLSRGKQKASHVQGLKLSLEEQKEEVKNVRDTVTEAAKADNVISRQLQKLDNREGKTSHVCYLIKCMLLSYPLYIIAKFGHWFCSPVNKVQYSYGVIKFASNKRMLIL